MSSVCWDGGHRGGSIYAKQKWDVIPGIGCNSRCRSSVQVVRRGSERQEEARGRHPEPGVVRRSWDTSLGRGRRISSTSVSKARDRTMICR